MALREQPYLPLYVQDYLSDEKLSCCSLSTQGVYIRIMCVLHKSETYGGILFKQIPKQNFNSHQYFAFVLSKQTGIEFKDMIDSIEELLFFNVLKGEKKDGVDFLFQKRMVKDFTTSENRSKAGKKGGGNPNLFKQKSKQSIKQSNKQTDKQNPEYEYEYEYIDNNIENKGGMGEKEEQKNELNFEKVWEAYEKKGNKKTSQRKWDSLPKKTKLLVIDHVPRYVQSTPDKQYRKNFETYINQEVWNDEIILKNDGKSDSENKNQGAVGLGDQGNRKNPFRTDAEKRSDERKVLGELSRAILQQPASS